jgi:hypothetical protein
MLTCIGFEQQGLLHANPPTLQTLSYKMFFAQTFAHSFYAVFHSAQEKLTITIGLVAPYDFHSNKNPSLMQHAAHTGDKQHSQITYQDQIRAVFIVYTSISF